VKDSNLFARAFKFLTVDYIGLLFRNGEGGQKEKHGLQKLMQRERIDICAVSET
jgi:hypothetical protein